MLQAAGPLGLGDGIGRDCSRCWTVVSLPLALGLTSVLIAWLSAAPPWVLMWLLAVGIFASAKVLTWSTAEVSSSRARQLGYLFAWPGLDANAFLTAQPTKGGQPTKLIEQPTTLNAQPTTLVGQPKKIDRPTVGEWLFAAVKFAFGLAMLFGVARLVPLSQPMVVGWVGMTGLAFVVHFGLFHLLSCAWRSAGVDAKPLMDWPILSQSVSQYWGRRWNTAFRDLAHRFLFQPLTALVGPRWGIAGGFLFSGLVHDVVITVPAGGGYGLPTVYFLFQGAALLLERSAFGRALGLRRGLSGRAFTCLVVVGPAPLLFHPLFVTRIVVPFMQAIGAVE
jgi:hypothetical protein